MRRDNIPYITVLSLMVSHLFVVYIDKPTRDYVLYIQ